MNIFGFTPPFPKVTLPLPLNFPLPLNLPLPLNFPLPFNLLPKNNLGNPKPPPLPSAPGTTPVAPLAPPEPVVTLSDPKTSSTFN